MTSCLVLFSIYLKNVNKKHNLFKRIEIFLDRAHLINNFTICPKGMHISLVLRIQTRSSDRVYQVHIRLI